MTDGNNVKDALSKMFSQYEDSTVSIGDLLNAKATSSGSTSAGTQVSK